MNTNSYRKKIIKKYKEIIENNPIFAEYVKNWEEYKDFERKKIMSQLSKPVDYIKNKVKENLIGIYGIGSYFSTNLPKNWKSYDIDIIVVVNSLEGIKTSSRRFSNSVWENVDVESNNSVFIAYHSINALKNKEKFEIQSFVNYKWAILSLKENSIILFGKDIRDELQIQQFDMQDYEDILQRALYHLDMSFRRFENPRMSFSKSVFKFGFFLNILYDKTFQSTSIFDIEKNLKKLLNQDRIKDEKKKTISKFKRFISASIKFRISANFNNKFKRLRFEYAEYILSSLYTRNFHKKMDLSEIEMFLENSYEGLHYLLMILSKVKNKL